MSLAGRTRVLMANLGLAAATVLWAACSTSLGPGPQPSTRASTLANQSADRAMYTSVAYANAAKRGPFAIVLPGEFKSSNASGSSSPASNIADYGELELSRANFVVLERSRLGELLQELQTAYALGDQESVRTILQRGGLATTRWIVKFDVLKFEPVAEVQKSAGVAPIVKDRSDASIWIVGMRYTIVDANTTQQVASNYFEEKMEAGAASDAFLGLSSSQKGQVTLDSMAHRLVQRAVTDIDKNYK